MAIPSPTLLSANQWKRKSSKVKTGAPTAALESGQEDGHRDNATNRLPHLVAATVILGAVAVFMTGYLVIIPKGQVLQQGKMTLGPIGGASMRLRQQEILTATGDSECPLWLSEYEAFHATIRLSLSARYLVHRVERPYNKGLGDRLRAMLFATRLAYATGRVVLFSWEQPYDVSDFLEPASRIDWRTQGTGYRPDEKQLKLTWMNVYGNGWFDRFRGEARSLLGLLRPSPRLIATTGGLTNLPDTFVTLVTNELMHSDCEDCPPLDPWGASAVCLWNRLFRFVPEIQTLAEKQERLLFAQPRPPDYVGMHLRLGGFTGEDEQEAGLRGHKLAQLYDVITVVQCARRLADRESIIVGRTPMLLITDNDMLRQFALGGNLRDVVTTNLTAAHLGKAEGLSREAHFSTFVDLVMLGRSHCLITSNSGFSHLAFLMGGQTCRLDLCDCFDVRPAFCGVNPPSLLDRLLKSSAEGT